MKNNQTIQSALARCFLKENTSKPAIECGSTSLSYGQLSRLVHAITTELENKNVAVGDQLGIFSEDRILIIAAAIAALRLRCVFVPFDTDLPTERTRRFCETANLKLLITDHSSYRRFPDDLTIDKIELAIGEMLHREQDFEPSFHATEAQSDDSVYVYFTSGTSGKPKGILGTNKGLLHFVQWEINELNLRDGVRVSQITSPGHDPFLRDVFTTLATVGTICIPPERNTVLSPFGFKRWLADSGIELLHITPTVFRHLCNSEALKENDFKSLKWVLLAGEKLYSRDLEKWYTCFGDRIQLINLYGPSETTLAKLFYRISMKDLDNPFVPIGQAMNGAEVILLNDQMQHCTYDEPGELYIHTPYRTQGYYNAPELTNQVFIPNPISGGDSEDAIYYKTGDIVMRRADENIVFLDRADRQLKIRGKRAEPGEVETEILSFPGILQTAVLVSGEDSQEHPNLKAFYVAYEEVDHAQLTEHLKKHLPDYLIPRSLERLDSLPFNVNGKLDSDKLLNESASSNGVSSEQVTKKHEEGFTGQLTTIWKEILEKDEIGIQDSFMMSGGDSLGIMQLIARIHTDFEFELTLWQIFDGLTIEKLEELITEHRNS